LADDAFTLKPIGVIHSPFTQKENMPIQASRSQATGHVEVFEDYAAGLKDIEGLSHLILLYVFHRSAGYSLEIEPFLDDQRHGVFTTRYPYRPTPIGLSIVKLEARQGNQLEVSGIDVLDGTPLLDIKPYIPEFDVRSDVRTGWYATRSRE
jgi:tRNA-Thr(GGU) m(6)t(6)A37 methyltransferase TsaA